MTLVMAGLGLTACETDNNHAFHVVPPVEATELCLYINGEHYDIALPAQEAVNLTTLCTEFDADIQIGNAAEFQSITVGGKDASSGSCTLPIDAIDSDKQIEIAYTTGDVSGTVRLNTLHSGIPYIEARGRALIPGDFYLSFIYQRLIMKYDNEGRCIY